jgi:hypothetical protein
MGNSAHRTQFAMVLHLLFDEGVVQYDLGEFSPEPVGRRIRTGLIRGGDEGDP